MSYARHRTSSIDCSTKKRDNVRCLSEQVRRAIRFQVEPSYGPETSSTWFWRRDWRADSALNQPLWGESKGALEANPANAGARPSGVSRRSRHARAREKVRSRHARARKRSPKPLRWLMRTLSALLVAAAVVLAVALTAGRLFVAFVPTLEGDVNAALRGTGVELEGLSARWHWTNPVVQIDEVRFTGGRAHAVQAELDLPESLWELDAVLRVASVKSLELVAVHLPDGRWTLGHRAPEPRGDFEIDDWLRHSDALGLPDIKVTLLNQQPDQAIVLGEYALSAALVNRDSRHRGRIVVRDATSPCTGCELVAQWDVAEAVVGSSIESGVLSTRARGITIPQALGVALRAGGLNVTTFDVVWHIEEGLGTGRVMLDAHAFTLPTGGLAPHRRRCRARVARRRNRMGTREHIRHRSRRATALARRHDVRARSGPLSARCGRRADRRCSARATGSRSGCDRRTADALARCVEPAWPCRKSARARRHRARRRLCGCTPRKRRDRSLQGGADGTRRSRDDCGFRARCRARSRPRSGNRGDTRSLR